MSRKTIRVHVAFDIEVDANLPNDQLQLVVEKELAELKGASGAYGGQILTSEIRDLEPGDGLNNYTVVFFIDADRSVEYFVEQVRASNEHDAWELAIEQARESGCSSSGHSIGDHEWENATEITTLRGHNLSDDQLETIRRARAMSAAAA